MEGNLITWRCKKQKVVARSSKEVKSRVITLGVCELLLLKKGHDEVGNIGELPLSLYCENKAAINIAHDPVQHDRTVNVEIDRTSSRSN